MLTKVATKQLKANQSRFAIIASLYNSRYVDAMLRAARAELKRAGALSVQVIRVPGAYEIPVVAAALAQQPPAAKSSKPDAILCLGVILRGETTHAAHIGEAVSQALMQIQLQHQVPVIHEVLLLENEEQARVRCLGTKHNRGTEAAQTAISMAGVMRSLKP
jgi:6,7-dimethyl-8-ribityllumazine synthase